MARLFIFLGVVALGVAGALFLISERAAVTRLGYQVAQLEAEKQKLIERNRQLEARVARLKSPVAIAKRVKGLQIGLVPPEDCLDVPATPAGQRR